MCAVSKFWREPIYEAFTQLRMNTELSDDIEESIARGCIDLMERIVKAEDGEHPEYRDADMRTCGVMILVFTDYFSQKMRVDFQYTGALALQKFYQRAKRCDLDVNFVVNITDKFNSDDNDVQFFKESTAENLMRWFSTPGDYTAIQELADLYDQGRTYEIK